MAFISDLIARAEPWWPALLALLVAGAAGLAARWAGRPGLGALAAGIGALAGWWASFGLLTASPRQLPERLPLLLLVLVTMCGLLGLPARRWRVLAWPLAVLSALWVGWWMGGAPRFPPDLLRAAPVVLGIAAAALLLATLAAARWAGPVAAAALLGALLAAAAPGPQPLLAAALLGGALGAALLPGGPPGAPTPARAPAGRAAPAQRAPVSGVSPLAALPLAGAAVALGALPVLARGAPADWAAAAAPFAALGLGAPVGRMLGGGLAGALVVGVGAGVVAFMLR